MFSIQNVQVKIKLVWHVHHFSYVGICSDVDIVQIIWDSFHVTFLCPHRRVVINICRCSSYSYAGMKKKLKQTCFRGSKEMMHGKAWRVHSLQKSTKLPACIVHTHVHDINTDARRLFRRPPFWLLSPRRVCELTRFNKCTFFKMGRLVRCKSTFVLHCGEFSYGSNY